MRDGWGRGGSYLFLETQTDVGAFGEIVEQLRTVREAGRGAARVLELHGSARAVGMASVVDGAHGLGLASALGYDYRNRGLASEALRTIVEDAIEQPGVFRVWACHAVDNTAPTGPRWHGWCSTRRRHHRHACSGADSLRGAPAR